MNQRQDVLGQLLVQSGFALALTAVLALVLGRWTAGRILRRLRTITMTARDISATNLHRRLALPGPNDELKELGDTFDELLGRLEASFRRSASSWPTRRTNYARRWPGSARSARWPWMIRKPRCRHCARPMNGCSRRASSRSG